MTYIKIKNNEIVKTGNLFNMETRNSNPTLLSEEELKVLGVYKSKPFEYNLNIGEYFGDSTYNYDSVLDIVREVKEIKTIDLEVFKTSKLSEIKNTHLEIKSEGFTSTSGIKIDCEDKNLNDFANGKLLMDISGGTESRVIDYNNISHDLSAEDYTSLVLELGGYIIKLLNDKQILRGLINKSTTHLEVSEVYWRKANYSEDELEFIDYTYSPLVE